jgi:hypothetical protein
MKRNVDYAVFYERWGSMTDREKIEWISEYIFMYDLIGEFEDVSRKQRNDYTKPIIALYGHNYVRRGYGATIRDWNPIRDLNQINIAENNLMDFGDMFEEMYYENLLWIVKLTAIKNTNIHVRMLRASAEERSAAMFLAFSFLTATE